MAHRDGLESEPWSGSRNLYSVSSPWTGVREPWEWSEAPAPRPCHHRQTGMCVTQCLSEGSSVGLMSGIRGRKGWKGGSQNGVLWGCWGARRAQGGACSIPAEVWSCHPHGHPLDTQKSDSLIGCHGAPRGSPEMELGKGYVMNLEPWTRQLSTCLRVAESVLSPV